MRIYPYSVKNQKLKTDAKRQLVDRGFIAHFHISATDAVATDTDGIHLARTCPAVNVAATCVVKASTAVTDIITTTATVALGEAANDLSILLTTAADDVLAVSKNDGAGVITIALANATAAKNTATLIQAAIRALTSVAGVSVAAFTCVAGGNWDTAAIATGETAAVDFTGGVTADDDVLITGITDPAVPRNITATAGGTAGHIKAIQVIVEGTNYNDEAITETLPVFTVDTAGTVTGIKAFKTVTKITIPPHDGTGATTAIGFGSKIGLLYKLSHDTCLFAFLDNAKESVAPTVSISATAIENNTIELSSSLSGKIVDAYFIV
ncbi:MAG: hypothetical protein PHF63_08005 [Herbinix sp.]|nr:hypothetical protein [Herbinix sp.]